MTRFTWIQVLDLAVIFYIHLPGNQMTEAIKRIYHAETKGFEPLIPLRVYTLSRRAPSTTRTSLHFFLGGENTIT